MEIKRDLPAGMKTRVIIRTDEDGRQVVTDDQGEELIEFVPVDPKLEEKKEPRFIPPPAVAHPGAVHGPRMGGKRRWRKASHFERSTIPLSNHERVIYGRARRMGISVVEYQRRFGGRDLTTEVRRRREENVS